MLDIVLFRTDQGGDPDRIRKSQKDRYADVGLVDKVIEIDTEWRKTRGDLDDAKKAKGITQKGITEAMKKKETPAPELLEAKKAHEEKIAALEEKEKTLLASRQETIGLIGNLLPEDGSVPVDDDEDNNAVVDTWGAFETEDWMLSHYDLTQMTGIANTARGAEVAGSRGYFLVGAGALLNQALISYAQHFLTKRGSTMLQTPFAMNKSLMGKVAQLSDYDETLYKVALGAILTGAILCAQFCAQFSDGLSTASQVTGAGEDQYLIATSEQPICAYHAGEWLAPKELPIRYAGYSTCFRKEAGSHGRDQLGIFRVHQFEKVEQFALTSPEGDISWKMQEEMIENSKEVTGAIPGGRNSLRAILRNSLTACVHTTAQFYKSLGIPYRVVNIVSGALNDAAAKKYDLEAWFPGSKAHRELVSCSNCTDYQSRRLEVRYGQAGKGKDGDSSKKVYVHMLNSTLCATERALCCLLENYQTKGGVKVPPVLVPYMGGVTFIPFVNPPPKPKKGAPAPAQFVPTKEQIAELSLPDPKVAAADGKEELQAYMGQLMAPLNAALNKIAKERPAEPLKALAALLAE